MSCAFGGIAVEETLAKEGANDDQHDREDVSDEERQVSHRHVDFSEENSRKLAEEEILRSLIMNELMSQKIDF